MSCGINTAEDVSLPGAARGVVASLEDGEMISGDEIGISWVGGTVAMGVLSSDGWLDTAVSITGGRTVVGLGVAGSELLSREKRGDALADLFEGTVLLRYTPDVGFGLGTAVGVGVTGAGTPVDRLEVLEDTDAFRRMLPNRRTLSAPALALELDLPMTVLDLPGVFGVEGVLGDGAPL